MGRDGIIRRLDYDEKTQPTPGRAEANQRQKQGLPLLVYCRIRPLSQEEQRHTQHSTAQHSNLWVGAPNLPSSPISRLWCCVVWCGVVWCCAVLCVFSASGAGWEGV